MTVSALSRTNSTAELAGGGQAANTLQRDRTSRYAMTANPKVVSTMAVLLLVKGRPACVQAAVIKGVHVALFLTVY